MDINKLLLNHGITKGQSSGSDSNTTPPSPIKNFTATTENGGVVLSWTNPTDATFYGVRIQRKTGSYPTNHIDGTTVFSGVATSFTDTGVTSSETYYYRAFTYNMTYIFNNSVTQQAIVSTDFSSVYTIIIDTTNSNPSTSVTYADDAVGMIAGSSSWDNVFPFNEIKPVLFLNGAVNHYLNPNNYAQKLDGTPADITTGESGDVMIQFPKIYTYIRKIGSLIYVSLSKDKINSNFECLGHTKSGIEKDYSYIAAYPGTWISSKMRSVSSNVSTVGGTRLEIRTAAQNNGAGYQIFSYYQFLMIQVLYLIKYKNLNSQTTVGFGYLESSEIINGTLDSAGMTFGNNDDSGYSVKLFGIENLWGAYYETIDGIVVDNSFNVYTANDNFNNQGTGYTNHGVALGSTSIYNPQYITNVIGTTELGFLPIAASNGSQTTYFCDGMYLSNSSSFVTGGVFEQLRTGIFYTDFWNGVDYDNNNACGRLAYL